MYRISTRGQYALLIMTDLAENDCGKCISLKLLSHRRNLPIKYLEQILLQLGKNGFVSGSRGTNGGYKLNRDASEYTVGEILRAMEGDLSPRGSTESNHLSSAGNEYFWNDFEQRINDFVDSVTLEDLVQKNTEFIGYEYCI
ncbi:MAG TPA: Rrf2 family transcriptional regulator [Treponema sp.]|nr:Rrf2 family transcriptional regulator [Treponema sp.]